MNNWDSEAICINAKKYGENDAILEVFTRDFGRVSGFVYGGASKRKKALLEIGQRMNLSWRTKQEGQLGYFERFEPIGSIAPILSDNASLCALGSMCSLLHYTIPEALKYEALFQATQTMIELLCTNNDWPQAYIAWEVGLLQHCGFGLDLSECALSGVRDNLAFISPKSGRAASYEAGQPYKDKLLILPPFLTNANAQIKEGDIADGFALTGFFLERDLLKQNYSQMPQIRGRLIYALGRAGRL
jgi:DNA repair protein RecO (recombination protein O)